MSSVSNASKSQASSTIANTTPTTAFAFGSGGAGDAAKPNRLSRTPTQVQNKPVIIFSTSASSTPAQSTISSFGTLGSTIVPLTSTSTTVPQTMSALLQASRNTMGLITTTTMATTPFPTQTTVPAEYLALPSLLGGSSTPTTASLGFLTPTTTTSTVSFSLGGTTTTTTTAAPSVFPAKPLTGFGVGGGEAIASTASSGLTFGTPSTMATGTGFRLSTTPTVTTATSTATTTTTTTTGFSLTASATTSAVTGFTFGTGTTAISTTGFSLNQTPSTQSITSTQASLGTTTTVTSSVGTLQPASISSFEESINKWTLELEEQEKVFVNQAAQINAWDKLLITNGEKIIELNHEVERVKIEQHLLEHELDYVVGQQKELQDCLEPLEKELASISVSDPEREYTYRLAEDLDTQLKRMSEDLKEIIEHLNQANRTQDSSDPIVQIGKILNAHMNSLQWLDQQTAIINQKIQQIDQMHQNFRQENERSFNLAYN